MDAGSKSEGIIRTWKVFKQEQKNFPERKIEISEVREKNEVPETQRNKKKSEECQEDVEKIKKKKNKNDDDLRTHTEKDDGKEEENGFETCGKETPKKRGQK